MKKILGLLVFVFVFVFVFVLVMLVFARCTKDDTIEPIIPPVIIPVVTTHNVTLSQKDMNGATLEVNELNGAKLEVKEKLQVVDGKILDIYVRTPRGFNPVFFLNGEKVEATSVKPIEKMNGVIDPYVKSIEGYTSNYWFKVTKDNSVSVTTEKNWDFELLNKNWENYLWRRFPMDTLPEHKKWILTVDENTPHFAKYRMIFRSNGMVNGFNYKNGVLEIEPFMECYFVTDKKDSLIRGNNTTINGVPLVYKMQIKELTKDKLVTWRTNQVLGENNSPMGYYVTAEETYRRVE